MRAALRSPRRSSHPASSNRDTHRWRGLVSKHLRIAASSTTVRARSLPIAAYTASLLLMNIASDSDLWMFISSARPHRRPGRRGRMPLPLRDGRQAPRCAYHHGPLTLLRVRRCSGEAALWQPFSDRTGRFRHRRNLYKNTVGNR